MKLDNLDSMSDSELLQQYSNACAQLGNVQTVIHELKTKMNAIAKDLEMMDTRYQSQVAICLQIKTAIDKKGNK